MKSAHSQPPASDESLKGLRRPSVEVALFGLVVLVAIETPVSTAQASATNPSSATNTQKYFRTWNYEPDGTTVRHIAVISCPTGSNGWPSSQLRLPLDLPQLGNVVFSAAADGTVVGRTNQGCTWRFAVAARWLELSPPGPYCFNHNVGSSYALNRWSVGVVGNHDREVVVGVSHQPNGDDLVTTMNYGATAKAGVFVTTFSRASPRVRSWVPRRRWLSVAGGTVPP